MSGASPGTFLVVDDSRLHHQMYKVIFSQAPLTGSTLLHAHNGREGYAALTTRPDVTLVFLDLNMPEMNGLEFLARRRAEALHPHIPVVLVTTESTAEDEARGRSAGAWEYLRKPFTPADVVGLVARAQAEARGRAP
ncbi:MAG TPA: response regulator [Gemmatimonadales bacterium]|nr:response regulator [Gemmatimonadales bacterium]